MVRVFWLNVRPQKFMNFIHSRDDDREKYFCRAFLMYWVVQPQLQSVVKDETLAHITPFWLAGVAHSSVLECACVSLRNFFVLLLAVSSQYRVFIHRPFSVLVSDLIRLDPDRYYYKLQLCSTSNLFLKAFKEKKNCSFRLCFLKSNWY